jgi:hypothetical protein
VIGLQREEEAALRKNTKSEPLAKLEGRDNCGCNCGLVREALYETVIAASLACVDEVLEAERSRSCGTRYQHLSGRQGLPLAMSPS